jgi:serine protease Do
MTLAHSRLWRLSARTSFALLLALCIAAARPSLGDETKPVKEITRTSVLDKPVPENVDDLKAIEKQEKTVLGKVMPCVVGLQVNGKNGQSWQGSGVIVREDGYVLTAGHVSGDPDSEVTVILPDGTKLKGKSLGANNGIDSGLIKITKDGKYPFAEMGVSKDVKDGAWCICVGHPGGYKEGRTPVVRLGRILAHNDNHLTSDCTMVGGDSGGPLFDMEGKVIGINSRIGMTINANIHVPVDTYRETWDRLAKGEVWGGIRFGNPNYMGFKLESDKNDCTVTTVDKNSPADKAGMRVGDVILKFDGKEVKNYEDVRTIFRKKKPGDEVEIEVKRDTETLTLRLTIGKRPA